MDQPRPAETLIEIYFAFIRTVLEYGDVVWGNCTKDNSELLKKIQIDAARIITGLRVNSSKSNLYSELGLEPLQARRDKHKQNNKRYSSTVYVWLN